MIILKNWALLLGSVGALALVLFVPVTYAAWTPLVASADFTGITTDVTTAATGIITICIIVLGVWLIVKAMSH